MMIQFEYKGIIYDDDQKLLEKIKEELPLKTIMQYITMHPEYGDEVLSCIAEFDQDLYEEIIAGVVEDWADRKVKVIVAR